MTNTIIHSTRINTPHNKWCTINRHQITIIIISNRCQWIRSYNNSNYRTNSTNCQCKITQFQCQTALLLQKRERILGCRCWTKTWLRRAPQRRRRNCWRSSERKKYLTHLRDKLSYCMILPISTKGEQRRRNACTFRRLKNWKGKNKNFCYLTGMMRLSMRESSEVYIINYSLFIFQNIYDIFIFTVL